MRQNVIRKKNQIQIQREMIFLNKDSCDYEDALKDPLFYKDTLLTIYLSDLAQPL